MVSILVVDDHENFRTAMTRFLNMEGYFAIAVESGFRALEYLVHHTVDLVMIDYAMPEMDGITLMEEILKAWPGLPLIMLTGYADSDSSHKAGLNGITYLVKPAGCEILKTVITRTLKAAPPPTALATKQIQCGNLMLDMTKQEVYQDGQHLECLTSVSCQVLAVLMQNQGQVITPFSLWYRVNGTKPPKGKEKEFAKRCIHKLRKAIEKDPPHWKYIHKKGEGYTFVDHLVV